MRRAPPSSHVCDFNSISVTLHTLIANKHKFTLTLLSVLGDGEYTSWKRDGLS